jgi:hypothetical protein
MEATDLETNPEATEVVVEQQEFRDEEAVVDTLGSLEDRYGDRQLVIGKECVPEDVGRRQQINDLRDVPERLKGRGHSGSTVEKRRRKGPERNGGIKGREGEDTLQELHSEKRILISIARPWKESDWTL